MSRNRRNRNTPNSNLTNQVEKSMENQENEIIATEDMEDELSQPSTPVDEAAVFSESPVKDEESVPVKSTSIEELSLEHMTLTEVPDNEHSELSVDAGVEPNKTSEPETPKLVNTIQNLASDNKVSTWDSVDPTNTLHGVIENVLTTYENAMKAKMPVNRTAGAQKQTELYQIIVRVAQSRNHFKTNWELILKHFNENRTGCYSVNYVMRFLDEMKVTKNDLTLFTRLVNLIMLTADPLKITENLRRVSIEKTLDNVSSPIIRGNIIGYYRNFVS